MWRWAGWSARQRRRDGPQQRSSCRCRPPRRSGRSRPREIEGGTAVAAGWPGGRAAQDGVPAGTPGSGSGVQGLHGRAERRAARASGSRRLGMTLASATSRVSVRYHLSGQWSPAGFGGPATFFTTEASPGRQLGSPASDGSRPASSRPPTYAVWNSVSSPWPVRANARPGGTAGCARRPGPDDVSLSVAAATRSAIRRLMLRGCCRRRRRPGAGWRDQVDAEAARAARRRRRPRRTPAPPWPGSRTRRSRSPARRRGAGAALHVDQVLRAGVAEHRARAA